MSADYSLESSQDAMLQQQVIHEVRDRGNRILTEWIFTPNNGIRLNVNNNYIVAADQLISEWDLNEIPSTALPGTLLQNQRVRIDLQGLFNNQNNVRFAHSTCSWPEHYNCYSSATSRRGLPGYLHS